MENSEQSQVFDNSVQKWKRLMSTRNMFTRNGIDTDHLDRAIDLAFLSETHGHLDSAIKNLEELISIASQMDEWGIDRSNIERVMALVFDPGNQMVYTRDIARWYILEEMRGQLIVRCMRTKSIDSQLLRLFQVNNNACFVVISL